MFPVLEALAAAGELLPTAAVPEDPPPQANKKITLKIKKFLMFIILPIFKKSINIYTLNLL